MLVVTIARVVEESWVIEDDTAIDSDNINLDDVYAFGDLGDVDETEDVEVLRVERVDV